MDKKLNYFKTPLNEIPWISHGFFTRDGGVSEGIYAGLNCGLGSGDSSEHIHENRQRVTKTLGFDTIQTLSQIHSPDVINVTTPFTANIPKADAMVTATAGIGIGILTADCVPVLFASKKDKIVGAAHAGWKGAIGGVLENTIAAMEALGANRADIAVDIGPCIGPNSYEVSTEFSEPFLQQDQENWRFFKGAEKAGHLIFDIGGYVAAQVMLAGVHDVYNVGEDTLPNETKYFSYRRSCHRKESDYGRQVSVIGIREE